MAATQSEILERMTLQAMRVLRGVENQDVGALVDAYTRAKDGILARIQQAFAGSETWSLEEMSQGRADQLLRAINMELAALNDAQIDLTSTAASDQLRASLGRTAYMLDQATPPALPVALPNLPETAIRALVATPFQGAMFSQRFALITDQMASDIRGQLIQSMINGESMQAAADRVAGVIGGRDAGYAGRALSIARTEIMRGQNLGRLAVFETNTDLMAGTPIWVATADDRLCPWCLRRDGLTVEEIERAATQGDPWGNAAVTPLHPNCRCTWMPRLKTWEELGIPMDEDHDPDEIGMRDPVTGRWTAVTPETYEAWKQKRAGELGIALGAGSLP